MTFNAALVCREDDDATPTKHNNRSRKHRLLAFNIYSIPFEQHDLLYSMYEKPDFH